MKILSSLSFLLAVLPLSAQDAPPKPGAEHQKLAAQAGTWDAVMSMTGEDGKAVESKGTSVMKVACLGLWVVEDFSMPEFMGAPFQGHGVTGYDTKKGKCVGTWFDSMTTTYMTLEGGFDKTGKVLTMTGMGPGPAGEELKHRFVTTFHSADKHVLEMFVSGNGTEQKMMTITYTRRAEKVGDAKAPTK
jgi:hypothetical protein